MNKIFAATLFAVLFLFHAHAYGWENSNLYGKAKNLSFDLKDDFYFNVNYDWLINSKFKSGHSSNSAFDELQEILDQRLKDLMTDKEIKDAELIQNLYSLWLDWDSRNKNGLADLPERVKNITEINSLEALNEYFKTKESFNDSIVVADFGIGIDNKNSEFHNLELAATPLSLRDSAEYKSLTPNGERTKKMNDSIVKYLLGRLNYDDKKINEILDKSFEFEKKIAAHIMTYEEMNLPEAIELTYNPLSIQELREKSPVFPFAEILEAHKAVSNFMNLQEPEWLKALNEIYIPENLEIIKAYLLCSTVRNYIQVTDEEAYREYQKLSRERYGITESKTDDKLAVDFVHSMLPVPVSKIYCSKYVNENSKREITEIIDEIVEFYENLLSSSEWLSESTRGKAVEKLKAMKLNVAYPDKWVDFSGLEINPDMNFYDAYKKISDYKIQRYFYDRLNKKVDHDLWINDVVVVNSYYKPSENSINIIAGILGGEFYATEMSYEEKLGGIGAVIGHEISHAFDTIGAQFDKDGNVSSWWTEEDYEKFKARASKLIKYLDGFNIDGQKYNGSLVQFETIADMAGVKASLGIAGSHENFDYDKYFRKYAKIWKFFETKERVDRALKTDVHALPFLRVNAVIQQYEEFYKTYGIKSGDKMYLAPEERVAVW